MWLTACLSVRWVDACTWTAFLGPQGVSAGVTQYFTSHPLHLPGNGTLHGSKMASGWPLLTFDVSVFQSSAQYNGRVPSQGFILDLYQSREIFFVFYCQTVKKYVCVVCCLQLNEWDLDKCAIIFEWTKTLFYHFRTEFTRNLGHNRIRIN